MSIRNAKGCGVAARLKVYFTHNPDEVLTYGDIADKLDVTREQARRGVEYLRDRLGMVKTERATVVSLK